MSAVPADILLATALRVAPRRYRMPPLPASGDAAVAKGPACALAFAIEAARAALPDSVGWATRCPPSLRDLFTSSLAALLQDAMTRDPQFQALVLRSRDPRVAEFVRLSAKLAADQRTVRSLVDAIAHPGKLERQPPGSERDALAALHEWAAAGAWKELGDALPPNPALERLTRRSAMLELDAVRHYLALCEQHGPMAGTDMAAAQGRASTRVGEEAERETVDSFRKIAEWLDPIRYRVVRSLLTPRGFPGEVAKSKEEWDAAIVRNPDVSGPVDIALLAEVKASPAAASSDFSRLHRGLQRLAHADAASSYAFASADGEVQVAGESLRRLAPQDRRLPPHVIYCSTAPVESNPQVLGAATKAVLLAEPASLAYAQELSSGRTPSHEILSPVWDALTTTPRLRSALHQYETAQAVREAMLHPQDLLEAVLRAR